jgi:hypothetical protein
MVPVRVEDFGGGVKKTATPPKLQAKLTDSQ